MDFGKDSPTWKWVPIFAMIVVPIVVILVLFSGIFETERTGQIPDGVWLLVALLFMVAAAITVAMLFKLHAAVEESTTQVQKMSDEIEKMMQLLKEMNQGAHLTEIAKSIVFRDTDRQTLRDAVFDKLQQKDFETAYEIIDEIAHRTGYMPLAEQLRVQADKYRDATDVERVRQVIGHIDKLIENCEWLKASSQVEQLIEAYPDSEEARAIRQKLVDKKDERKKVLLNAWDEAVKREATDRSLEILRELDQYLTPNEALALQEAARDVFRSKLHNLGVQFSLAVSGRQWDRALETGESIISEFPNSRMAEEIREKLDVLRSNVGQKA